ncbi:ferrous iron transport protein B [Halobacteriovorax sp. HLS]|uniref:ferrous iron transport protein B n=1 Tax=Halobacteriovorax sp. HLS TaxID=2234000 RepID=UPI000FDB0FA5|nr:ferrous iron transport protein B [Halobacteriovorax sp. HLS]
MKTVLLVGFPNSGKSTIFNSLSGQFRKVSNYSGITVDSAVGDFVTNKSNETRLQVVDLPGIYNLIPSSMDEAVTTASILGLSKNIENYHLIALTIDLHRFEASLSLALALKDVVGSRLVLIVNKDDSKQIQLDQKKKLEELSGLKVITMSAKHDSPSDLDTFIRENVGEDPITPSHDFVIGGAHIDLLSSIIDSEKVVVKSNSEIFDSVSYHHQRAREISREVLSRSEDDLKFTTKLDKILIHPFFGSIVFIAIFYLIFHSIYTWSGPLMDLIDGGVSSFAEYVGAIVPDGAINSLLTDGIIAGVGGVVIFLPQIMILFFLLSLLEQSGYIARAAVMTDKVMGYFGLNGKAFLPYISGFACSIPGIMAARTIPDKRERMATIMTLPMITCSARLPVYVLLIGTFVPEKTVLGIFNAQALSFFFLYFLGSFFALVVAKVFRLTFYKGESSNFIIDLPVYQRPQFRLALKNSFTKGKLFLKKAGTVILGLSILIWFASTYPSPNVELVKDKSDSEVASITLEHSALGSIGRSIEPVLKPIGMDWKMGVGLLVAMGARELFVSTLGTIYALGDVDEESTGLRDRMKSEINPETGLPTYNLAVAWSILIFFVFALQCTSTLAILKKETEGWKIPTIMFSYMTVLAYIGSFVAYNLLS